MDEKELLKLVKDGMRVSEQPKDAEYLGSCMGGTCAYEYQVYRLKDQRIVYMQFRI